LTMVSPPDTFLILHSLCDPLTQVASGCEDLYAAQKARFGSRYFGRVP
jgi:hypothetical protein